jgi:shikimate dehydrogenase
VTGSYPVVNKIRPTFYFIGVTTSHSSIMRIFPCWMEVLGHPEIAIEGVDLPIHADPQAYRKIITQIKEDPNSLGGLVTTHKIDLVQAACDLFDTLDPLAELLGEISSISKQEGRLEGHAKDPISAGLSLDALLGEGYFERTGGHVLIFGAGGSATALLLHLLGKTTPADRPRRVTLVDRRAERLEHVHALAARLDTEIEVLTVCNEEPRQNDALLAALPPGSLVVNATGMGKDTPGSPVGEEAVFPRKGVIWEFNYRGELDFLHQARRQAESRELLVEDGWLYFLHGWTQVIAQVLHFELTPDLFEQLKEAAGDFRLG